MGQLKTLLFKNWILFKRGPLGSALEIIVPIFFALFLILFRRLSQLHIYKQQQFLANQTYVYTHYGDPITAASSLGVDAPVVLKDCAADRQIVALVPAGDPLVSRLNSTFSALGFTVRQYKNDDQIDQLVRDEGYGFNYPKFCFGISVQNSGSNYKYNLRFNLSNIWSVSQAPPTNIQLTTSYDYNPHLYFRSLQSGYLSATTIVNNEILQTETSDTHILVNKEGLIYQQPYMYDQLYVNLTNAIEFMFLLPLLIVYLRQTSFMLEEKEKKIRESMAISGMNLNKYYLTWFIRYFLSYLVIHLIISGIITGICPRVPYYIPLIVFILFDILLIIQSFFIQIFLTRAKIGIVVALLFFVLQYAINYIIANNQDITSQIYRYVSAIPHVAFILAFKEMIFAQSIETYVTFTGELNLYTIITAIISISINIVFWGVLAWYLDQVFPNEWGAKKHPLFCFMRNKKKSQSVNESQQNLNNPTIVTGRPTDLQLCRSNNERSEPQVQSVQQKYKEFQKHKHAITIKNLNKTFDKDIHAVKGLTMSMYSDQIFVLLGHNGAGKTTTISMLTGMLKPTSGFIQIMGSTDLSEIRKKIGVCPQHDTLYQNLTVQEHIRLFATFRGLEGDALQQEINKLIKDVNLGEKRNEYAKNLSGGQKRRLSVAMAFSGRSKVIILDQPTSGMDTSARRYIWEMLKNYKSNRIILLTTHFMDEADYLGDRIAIMALGRLVALGSNVYLKNKFGVGYNITFVKKSIEVESEYIIDCVMRHVSDATVLSNVSLEIAMQLPMHKVSKFPKMFAEIDDDKQQLGIEEYGISITTLEEVFLKIGEDEERKQKSRSASNYANSQTASNYDPAQRAEQQMQNKAQKKKKKKEQQDQIMEDEENWVREDGCCQKFVSHFLATILKRLRVVRRDLKSFIFELILPVIIIIVALFLMRISFVKDFQSQTLTYYLYQSQGTPILVPIAADKTESGLLNALKNQMTNTYGDLLNIQTYTQSSDLNFDSSVLKSFKKQYETFKGGIYFEPTTQINGSTIVRFTSIVNTKSPTSLITIQTLAAQAYINELTSDGPVTITPILKPFPKTYRQLRFNNAISGMFGALIFSIALAFKFASAVSFIVKERQDKSKHQQIVSGMNVAAYWLGNFLYDFVLYLILAIFSVVMCKVLSIQSFTEGSAMTMTVLLFLFYGLANIPFTYILGYLFKDYGHAQGAIYFFNFGSGGIFTTIIIVLRWVNASSNKAGRGVAWAFRIIPSFAFGEGLINMGSTTLISQIENNGVDMSPFDIQIGFAPLIYLIAFGSLYFALVFILQWLQNHQEFMRFITAENKQIEPKQIEDQDVIEEQKRAIAANPHEYEILTKKLRKVYSLDSKKKYKVAVDDLSFGVKKGQVFGLLGVNGAGKTTTFKMLAGEIVSTSGQSFLMGLKISDNLAMIRKTLGYCPQFDALIYNLTVKEQLELFYDLKCLPKKYKKMAIRRRIKQMNLEEYKNKLSGTLSGGNKRKLSVAIAMIGNPHIIFLDEPSTGMDPKARRFMWKIISRISTERKQSTVILTTHSMEEAEALSTRLGIMVHGNFKCIGTPQHIKSKYGKGFQIEIKLKNIKRDYIEKVQKDNKIETETITKEELQNFLNTLKVSDEIRSQISNKGSGSYIWFQFEHNSSCTVSELIQYITIQSRAAKITTILRESFGQIEILEHFQTYVRFKTDQKATIGKMFEFLQTKKIDLFIMQYSIKQATVEQIFNKFAEQEGSEMD